MKKIEKKNNILCCFTDRLMKKEMFILLCNAKKLKTIQI